MDKEQEMVMVNMDVGNRNTAGKFLRIVPRNSPFDVEKAKNYAKRLNPNMIFFEVSATTGEGMDKWYEYLKNLSLSKKHWA